MAVLVRLLVVFCVRVSAPPILSASLNGEDRHREKGRNPPRNTTHRKGRRPRLDPSNSDSARQPIRSRVVHLESFQGPSRFRSFAVPFAHDAGVGGCGGGGREDGGEGAFVCDGAEEGGDACARAGLMVSVRKTRRERGCDLRRFFLAPCSPESGSSWIFSPKTYRFLLAVFCIVSLYSVGRPSSWGPRCFPLRSAAGAGELCWFKRTEILAFPSGVFLPRRGEVRERSSVKREEKGGLTRRRL